MPSFTAACASFRSFLNAAANEASARSVNCCSISATPRLLARTASASKRDSAPCAATATQNTSPTGPEILRNLIPKVSSPTAAPRSNRITAQHLRETNKPHPVYATPRFPCIGD